MIAIARNPALSNREAGARNRARVVAEYKRLLKSLGAPPAIRLVARRVGLDQAGVWRHLVAVGVRPANPRNATHARIVKAYDRLGSELGRQPLVREVAQAVGVSYSSASHYLGVASRSGEIDRPVGAYRPPIGHDAPVDQSDHADVLARAAALRLNRLAAITPQPEPTLSVTEAAVRDYWRAWRNIRRAR